MPDDRASLPAYAADHITIRGDGCWIWTGARSNTGYGIAEQPCSCGEASKPRPAHRVVYEALVGPIPDGLQLDHLCRTRACVNPVHLDPVTTRENTLRGTGPSAVNAAKTHCDYGHEFTPENTYVKPRRGRANHSRECRACRRLGRSLTPLERKRLQSGAIPADPQDDDLHGGVASA